jgi:hypothetical protein
LFQKVKRKIPFSLGEIPWTEETGSRDFSQTLLPMTRKWFSYRVIFRSWPNVHGGLSL